MLAIDAPVERSRPPTTAPRLKLPSFWRLFAASVLLGFILLGVVGPLLAPHDPRIPVGRPFAAPGGSAILGTNDLGQDVLSIWLSGARSTVVAALGITALSTLLAWTVGLSAGFFRRATLPLMGLTDLMLALPGFSLALLIIALVGPSQGALIVTLGLLSWPGFARIVRSAVIGIRNELYIEAAESIGASPFRVMTRHVFPATLGLFGSKLVLTVRYAIFAETSLAFLGLGDPASKSWGSMIGLAIGDPLLFARGAWPWLLLPPAISIIAVVWASSIFALEVKNG